MKRDDRKRRADEFEASVRLGFEEALKSPNGRAMMWSLLELTQYSAPSFNPDSVRLSDFAEGKRDIGIKLVARCLQAHPNSYLVLLQEQQHRVLGVARQAGDAGDSEEDEDER